MKKILIISLSLLFLSGCNLKTISISSSEGTWENVIQVVEGTWEKLDVNIPEEETVSDLSVDEQIEEDINEIVNIVEELVE